MPSLPNLIALTIAGIAIGIALGVAADWIERRRAKRIQSWDEATVETLTRIAGMQSKITAAFDQFETAVMQAKKEAA